MVSDAASVAEHVGGCMFLPAGSMAVSELVSYGLSALHSSKGLGTVAFQAYTPVNKEEGHMGKDHLPSKIHPGRCSLCWRCVLVLNPGLPLCT